MGKKAKEPAHKPPLKSGKRAAEGVLYKTTGRSAPRERQALRDEAIKKKKKFMKVHGENQSGS